MSRLQKKCFIAASGMHLLLVVILLVGPAFLAAHTRKAEDKDFKIMDVIPGKLIDEAFSGGGTPNAAPPAPAPPQPTPVITPPTPAPPKTLLQKIEKVFTPEPPKPEKAEPEKPEVDPLALRKVTKTAPGKSKDDVPLKKVIRTAKATTTSKTTSKETAEDSEADARAQQRAAAKARAAAIGKSLSRLNSNLSTGVDVDIPGPGGAAYANYADALASTYYHAWTLPDEASNDNASVKVKVTLARDGSVISARVVQPSGNALLDRSVERALNRVKSFEPFPEGSKDATRTFNFEFQPRFRKLIG